MTARKGEIAAAHFRYLSTNILGQSEECSADGVQAVVRLMVRQIGNIDFEADVMTNAVCEPHLTVRFSGSR
jgi:hypothetical protein